MTEPTPGPGPLDHEFTATLQKSPSAGGRAYVVIPDSAGPTRALLRASSREIVDGLRPSRVAI